jgi:exonuclease III
MNTVSFSLISWNIRGLGLADKCDDVLIELVAERPQLVALQETKLASFSESKLRSFIPSRHRGLASVPATGSAGGILSAWDADFLSSHSMNPARFSLSTTFCFSANSSPFILTNIYAPAYHDQKETFSRELSSLAPADDIPWIVIGDFNLTRSPQDKNNDLFNQREATLFNDTIHSLGC